MSSMPLNLKSPDIDNSLGWPASSSVTDSAISFLIRWLCDSTLFLKSAISTSSS